MRIVDIPNHYLFRLLTVVLLILIAAASKQTELERRDRIESKLKEKAKNESVLNNHVIVSAFESFKDKNYKDQYNALINNISMLPELKYVPRDCVTKRHHNYNRDPEIIGRSVNFSKPAVINGYLVYYIVTRGNDIDSFTVCITKNGDVVDNNMVANEHMYPDFKLMSFDAGSTLVQGILPASAVTLSGIEDKYAEGIQFIKSSKDILKFAVTDLNKNGIPEISVLSHWGGFHCCFTGRITELGETATVLFAKRLGHDSPTIVDIEGDGIAEILAQDWSFAYWNACFYCSPAPNIVYKYEPDKNVYVMDNRLLKIAPPSDKLITEQAAGWSWCVKDYSEESEIVGQQEYCGDSYQIEEIAEQLDFIYDTPWGFGLDVIFAGHPEQAKRYIKLAWDNGEHQDGSLAHFADFWRLFGNNLKKSPNYPDLAHTIPEGYWE